MPRTSLMMRVAALHPIALITGLPDCFVAIAPRNDGASSIARRFRWVRFNGKGSGEKRACIVALRIGENLGCRALLHDLALPHDDDLIGERAHDTQVMADEEIGEAALRCNSRRRSTICACTDISSAEVGSSSTTNFGSSTMARAIAMRWRWPPENSCG